MRRGRERRETRGFARGVGDETTRYLPVRIDALRVQLTAVWGVRSRLFLAEGEKKLGRIREVVSLADWIGWFVVGRR